MSSSTAVAAQIPGQTAGPAKILCGLVISGFLLALPGGFLPLWGYHISSAFGTAGNYFLAVGLGLASGGVLARKLAERFAVARMLSAGCLTGALALLMLSVAAPPAQVWYQALALFVSGVAAGIVNAAVLGGLSGHYESNPATITLTAGIFFGAGSVLAPLLLSRSFDDASATRLLALAALVPGAAAVWLGRMRLSDSDASRRDPRNEMTGLSSHTLSSDPLASEQLASRELAMEDAMRDLRSPLAVVFALLLFFQFANEWSIAGWLPVFLIDRLGVSPATGVGLLAVYWLSLMVGRIVATRLLPVAPHGRVLGISAACALLGCIILAAGGSRFGMVLGLLLTGAGFSPIYPLAAEKIARRFTYYHPGYFNGIFTFALMGGILAPFLLGHLVGVAGLRAIPLAVMAGSCAVFVLILLIWLGRKVAGY